MSRKTVAVFLPHSGRNSNYEVFSNIEKLFDETSEEIECLDVTEHYKQFFRRQLSALLDKIEDSAMK
jgi:cell shape-determining protein MreC